MTSRPPFSALAAKALARVQVEQQPVRPDTRAAAIAATAAAIAARKRKQSQRRMRAAVVGGFALAAAIGGLAAGMYAWRSPSATTATTTTTVPAAGVASGVVGAVEIVRGGSSLPIRDGTSLSAGDRVHAQDDARASLLLPTGTRLIVESGGDVRLSDAGATQVHALASGSVRADVAKLTSGERFIIRTGDAEVEVRGTSFRVAQVAPDPSCGGGTRTRVDVYEGTVVVRAAGAETPVTAGEHWPRCTAPRTDVAPAPTAKPTTRLAPSAAPPIAPPPASSAPPASTEIARTMGDEPPPPSELSTQNDLFAQAVAAKRSGQNAAAVAAFERFLSRYPSSPLAETATAERMKLLATYDQGRAAAAARDYLARYPRGYARRDAEAIAGTSP
jgi:ferric-dicitrate binding protein FerR (iron transport regulator)